MPSAKENANAIDSVSDTEVNAITILAGKLFDSQAATLRHNVLLTVSPRSGLIVAVDTFEDDPAWLAKRGVALQDEAATIDLRGLTVLPGFVDAHVHREYYHITLRHARRHRSTYGRVIVVFLHPYSETSWEDQVTRESLAERTVRATRHARDTLMAGYTAVRCVPPSSRPAITDPDFRPQRSRYGGSPGRGHRFAEMPLGTEPGRPRPAVFRREQSDRGDGQLRCVPFGRGRV